MYLHSPSALENMTLLMKYLAILHSYSCNKSITLNLDGMPSVELAALAQLLKNEVRHGVYVHVEYVRVHQIIIKDIIWPRKKTGPDHTGRM